MRLYRTPAGAWSGTQADARAACLAEGAQPAAWAEIDVPTDKPGLLAWLNAQVAPATSSTELELLPAIATPAPATDPTALAAAEARRQSTAHAIAVEEEIAAADLPRTIRLCEHVHWRLQEHVTAAKAAAQ